MSNDRFDRNIRLFGQEGQQRLRSSRVAVVGMGGLGLHVTQQLAFLGVGGIDLIDSQELDHSNKNRYIGSRHDDPVPGTPKVDIGERLILSIDPRIAVQKVCDSLISPLGFGLVRSVDYVFGCVDHEGVRLVLNELCAAFARAYIDLGTEVLPGPPAIYGGRVCVCRDGAGCLSCLDVLDRAEAQRDLAGPDGEKDRAALYGVDPEDMEPGAGPSVVSVNGVVASLAVTEFMVAVTGLRAPHRLLTYRGDLGGVTVSRDEPELGCFYCQAVFGQGQAADLDRYLRNDIGRWLR